MIVCPECSRKLRDDAKFCDGCGAKLPETSGVLPVGEALTPPSSEKSKKTKLRSILLYGGFALVALTLMAAVVALITGVDNASSHYGLYLKDGEVFCLDLSQKSTLQVTKNLVWQSGKNTDIKELTRTMSTAATFSKDGQYIFYLDRGGNSGATLYYKAVSSQKSPTKIDTVDGSTYFVNDAASLVTYVKNGALYQYNMKKGEKYKVASDVSRYIVSDDGKSIFYLDSEKTLYLKKSGREKEEIDREVSNIERNTADFKTVYYLRSDDSGLFKKTDGKDKVKLLSDVYKVLKIYDSGEIYFLRSYNKPDADGIYTYVDYRLYYFDGSEESMIIEGFSSTRYLFDSVAGGGNEYVAIDPWIATRCAENAPVIVFCAAGADGSFTKWYVALGDTLTRIAPKGPSSFWIDSDGKTVYYIEGTGDGDLYKISIVNGRVEAPVLYDRQVRGGYSARFLADGRFVYFKEADHDDVYDMYIDKTPAGKDVDPGGVRYDEKNQRFLYYTGEDHSTLMVFSKGKTVKIDDHVHDYTLLPGGDILYVRNYSADLGRGDLYLYHGGRVSMVDTDVTGVVASS